MVGNEYLVFGYMLKGPLVQITGEMDGVLLKTSHHKYSKESGVEVAHACNQRLPLVEGALMVNDFSGNL